MKMAVKNILHDCKKHKNILISANDLKKEFKVNSLQLLMRNYTKLIIKLLPYWLSLYLRMIFVSFQTQTVRQFGLEPTILIENTILFGTSTIQALPIQRGHVENLTINTTRRIVYRCVDQLTTHGMIPHVQKQNHLFVRNYEMHYVLQMFVYVSYH